MKALSDRAKLLVRKAPKFEDDELGAAYTKQRDMQADLVRLLEAFDTLSKAAEVYSQEGRAVLEIFEELGPKWQSLGFEEVAKVLRGSVGLLRQSQALNLQMEQEVQANVARPIRDVLENECKKAKAQVKKANEQRTTYQEVMNKMESEKKRGKVTLLDAENQVKRAAAEYSICEAECKKAVTSATASTTASTIVSASNYLQAYLSFWEKGSRMLEPLRASVDKHSKLGAEMRERIQREDNRVFTVFGLPLEEVVARDGQVPPFVFELITYIGVHGVDEEGIFRIPGNMENLHQLKRRLDNGTAQNLTLDLPVSDAAGLLKMYLRDLPGPLIPFSIFNDLMGIDVAQWAKGKKAEVEDKILECLARLPGPVMAILKPLVHLCTLIVQKVDVNKMDSSNIARSIAPGLMRSESTDVATVLKVSHKSNDFFQHLVENYTLYFERTLHDCASTGNLVRLKDFIKGDLVTAISRDDQGCTILHHAARYGKLEVCRYVLESFAEFPLNAQDAEGLTALHYSVRMRHLEVSAYLLARGANAGLMSKNGVTVWHDTPQPFVNDVQNLSRSYEKDPSSIPTVLKPEKPMSRQSRAEQRDLSSSTGGVGGGSAGGTGGASSSKANNNPPTTPDSPKVGHKSKFAGRFSKQDKSSGSSPQHSQSLASGMDKLVPSNTATSPPKGGGGGGGGGAVAAPPIPTRGPGVMLRNPPSAPSLPQVPVNNTADAKVPSPVTTPKKGEPVISSSPVPTSASAPVLGVGPPPPISPRQNMESPYVGRGPLAVSSSEDDPFAESPIEPRKPAPKAAEVLPSPQEQVQISPTPPPAVAAMAAAAAAAANARTSNKRLSVLPERLSNSDPFEALWKFLKAESFYEISPLASSLLMFAALVCDQERSRDRLKMGQSLKDIARGLQSFFKSLEKIVEPFPDEDAESVRTCAVKLKARATELLQVVKELANGASGEDEEDLRTLFEKHSFSLSQVTIEVFDAIELGQMRALNAGFQKAAETGAALSKANSNQELADLRRSMKDTGISVGSNLVTRSLKLNAERFTNALLEASLQLLNQVSEMRNPSLGSIERAQTAKSMILNFRTIKGIFREADEAVEKEGRSDAAIFSHLCTVLQEVRAPADYVSESPIERDLLEAVARLHDTLLSKKGVFGSWDKFVQHFEEILVTLTHVSTLIRRVRQNVTAPELVNKISFFVNALEYHQARVTVSMAHASIREHNIHCPRAALLKASEYGPLGATARPGIVFSGIVELLLHLIPCVFQACSIKN